MFLTLTFIIVSIKYATPSITKIAQYLKGRSSRLLQEILGTAPLGTRVFLCKVGAVTDQMIREYIEKQTADEYEENFKVTI